MFRRKFLKAASVASLGAVTAGCMGGEQEQATETVQADANTDTRTPRPETTETDTAATETGDGAETDAAGELPDLDSGVGDTAQGLEVTNRELYRTNGEVGLRGTVENVGNRTYEYVEAEVTLQDDQGEVLYEFIDESEEADVSSLPPGNTWQFNVVFQEAQMAEVTSYTINLDGEVAATATGEGTPDAYAGIDGEVADDTDPNFEIVSHALATVDQSAAVSGEVKNVGDETANSVEVSVTLYDPNDDEIGVFTASTEEEEDVSEIPPGESWQFVVRFPEVDVENVERYVISVDSDLV